MKTALLLAFFIATTVVRGDSGDDTLKFYLSRSDLVATGKIITEPGGVIEEVGVIQYTCDFRVQDVIKGDGARKEQIIKLNIMRFEGQTPVDQEGWRVHPFPEECRAGQSFMGYRGFLVWSAASESLDGSISQAIGRRQVKSHDSEWEHRGHSRR